MNSIVSKKLLYASVNEPHKVDIQQAFEREGYEVSFIHQGDEVINQAIETQPDIIVLDVVLPNIDGIELCSEFRKMDNFKSIPIVFVSSYFEEFTQIAALEAGADHYLIKPARPRLIISHINAVLRRAQNPTTTFFSQQKNILDIDEEKLCAIVHGEFIHLALKEFEILKLLLSRPGRVFNRNEIFINIWSDNSTSKERTIDVHIRKLRKKIGEHFISTFKGVGYKIDLT